mmetsp:Transcript_5789/g.13906  ORF Transcript_5789/g.13906 Transcript_5789/m.13906 type:complete len:274 (-) Transcript_5789:1586-2407(-)
MIHWSHPLFRWEIFLLIFPSTSWGFPRFGPPFVSKTVRWPKSVSCNRSTNCAKPSLRQLFRTQLMPTTPATSKNYQSKSPRLVSSIQTRHLTSNEFNRNNKNALRTKAMIPWQPFSIRTPNKRKRSNRKRFRGGKNSTFPLHLQITYPSPLSLILANSNSMLQRVVESRPRQYPLLSRVKRNISPSASHSLCWRSLETKPLTHWRSRVSSSRHCPDQSFFQWTRPTQKKLIRIRKRKNLPFPNLFHCIHEEIISRQRDSRTRNHPLSSHLESI